MTILYSAGTIKLHRVMGSFHSKENIRIQSLLVYTQLELQTKDFCLGQKEKELK